MPRCRNCAQELSVNSAFCGACGVAVITKSPSSRRRKVPWVTIGLTAVGVVSLVLIGFRFISKNSAEYVGGAGSPEAAVEQFALALSSEDVFAATSYIAPDEIDGLTDVLDSFLSVIDAGSGGLVNGTDVEVEIEVTDLSSSMQGDNASIVSFTVSGSVTPGVTNGPVGVALPASLTFGAEELDDLYPGRGDEVDVVTVKLGSKWFVSPMLTMGHIFVERYDLANGDFDIVGSNRQGGGVDPEDAVDGMFRAIENREAEDLADFLGGGEGRLAAVFSDAIDELLGEISPDVNYSIDAQLSPGEDNRVILDDIEVAYSDLYNSGSVEVDGDCVAVMNGFGERDRVCWLDELPLIADVDNTIEFVTVREGGATRVRLIPSITDIAARLVPAFDRQTYLYATEFDWADTATAVAVGSDTAINLDGALYAVHEFEALANQRYRVTSDLSSQLWYRNEEGTWEKSWSSSITPKSATKVRVVTRAEERCSEICFPESGGSDTLRVRAVPVQTGPFPSKLVGELGPGDEILFILDVSTTANVQMVFNAGGSFVWDFVDRPAYFDGTLYVLEPGQVSISVVNNGSDRGSFELFPEQVRVGFDGARRLVVNLSAGAISTRVYLPAGSSTITAIPLDGQDIVLYVSSTPPCSSDVGGYGDAESCRVFTEFGRSGYLIDVRGYGYSDERGQVELVLS